MLWDQILRTTANKLTFNSCPIAFTVINYGLDIIPHEKAKTNINLQQGTQMQIDSRFKAVKF